MGEGFGKGKGSRFGGLLAELKFDHVNLPLFVEIFPFNTIHIEILSYMHSSSPKTLADLSAPIPLHTLLPIQARNKPQPTHRVRPRQTNLNYNIYQISKR